MAAFTEFWKNLKTKTKNTIESSNCLSQIRGRMDLMYDRRHCINFGVLALVSLVLAYRGAPFFHDSSAFQYEFDRLGFHANEKLPFVGYAYMGMLFHLGRLAIVFFFWYLINGILLRRDAVWMRTASFRFKNAPHQSNAETLLIVLGAVAISLFLIYHHVDKGPTELQTHWARDAIKAGLRPSKNFADYRIPYILFLPYSLIVVVVFLYLFPIRCFLIARELFLISTKKCRNLFLTPDGSVSDAEKLTSECEDAALSVNNSYWCICLVLIFWLSYLSYEYWLGRFVLTTTEFALKWAVFVMVAVSFLPLLVLFLCYERAYIYTMSHIGANETEWAKKLAIENFFVQSKVVTVAISFSLFMTPLGAIIKSLVESK